MKRSESFYDNPQSKKQKLEYGASSKIYPSDSARPLTEWDDDLSGDQLEEVCIIAELTQAPQIAISKQVERRIENDGHLIAENTRLKESIKLKEGEIGILRSQLKQNQTSKQNEAVNNLRNIDKLEEKHKLSLDALKKQVEQLESEIEFKNLEVKDLSEKCKQLEIKSPKVNFLQPSCVLLEDKKNLFSLSQAINAKTKNNHKSELEEEKSSLKFQKPLGRFNVLSDGENLSKHLDPSFFRHCQEPTVTSMFSSNASYGESLDHAKSDKYKWTGLPAVVSKIQFLEPLIVELLKSASFNHSVLKTIYDLSMEVFNSFINLLKFLIKLPMNINADKTLLEDTDPGKNWSLADILSNNLLRPVEKGVEVRRILGAICCILMSSEAGLELFYAKELLSVLHDIVKLIGQLMRPLEFCGVSIATLFFLQITLQRQDKTKACSAKLNLSKHIVNEIILSRPKLDVLREVIVTLASGSFSKELTNEFCKKSPLESSSLYMDSKLQQALFFNRDACPLKILQIQVKTLSHLCNSFSALLSVTNSFILWFYSLQANSYKPPVWLFPETEKCCNILECFCYLLTLLLPHAENEDVCKCMFEKGILALRNLCKGHKKKLKQTTLKLLPSNLRSSNLLEKMNFKAKEAALFVITEYESDVVTQDAVGNTFNCSDS